MSQLRRLKQLETENVRLKKLVAGSCASNARPETCEQVLANEALKEALAKRG